jgi:hypothetical protein
MGLPVKNVEGAVMVELVHDFREMAGGKADGDLLKTANADSASAVFQGGRESEAGFELLLLQKPISEAAMFPV